MSANPQTTPSDDALPDVFNLDQLRATLSNAEVDALTAEDDPVIKIAEAPAQADPAPALDDVLNPPVTAPAPAATAPAPQPQQPEPLTLQPVPDVTQAQATVSRLNDSLDELAEKYDSGELSRAEWVAQQQSIVNDLAAAKRAVDDAATIMQANQQTVADRWASVQTNYLQQPGYAVLMQPQHMAGWDSALRSINGNPQYANLPFEAQHRLAHTLYASAWNAQNPAQPIPLPGAAATAPNNTPRNGPRSDPRPDPVLTLAGLNADTMQNIEDGSNAALDRMIEENPIKYERLLAQMSPEERDALLYND